MRELQSLWRGYERTATRLRPKGRGTIRRTANASKVDRRNDPPKAGVSAARRDPRGTEDDEFIGEADGEVAGGSLGPIGTTPGPGVVRPMERASRQPRARPRGVRATSVEPATRGPAAVEF